MNSNTRALISVVGLFALLKVVAHLVVADGWGYHRDELLYLALGRHVDWGYWSTQPFIGVVSAVLQQVSSAGPAAVHFAAVVPSVGTLIIVGLMARDFGGGPWASAIACLSVLVSPGFLRTGALFQPVVYDVFFWTLATWFILRWIVTARDAWLWALGAATGLGMLNKYSMAFFVLGAGVAALMTRDRAVFRRPALWGGAALVVVMVAPNIYWQYAHHFPVVTHLRDLSMYQLGNVTSAGFLLDQLLTFMPALFFWVAGLLWLFGPGGRRYRTLGWTYVAILGLMLLLSGKSYYTMGAYPVLMAAGGVWMEKRSRALRWALASTAVAVGVAISPFSLPYLSAPAMASYSKTMVKALGTDAPLRWEDGRVYPLPQDYADMLGWERIGSLVSAAVALADDPAGTVVYAENYGQAGATEQYAGVATISFADSYRLWAPDAVPAGFNAMVYVNDGLGEDIAESFGRIREVGRVDNRYAREFGTAVWLCQDPDSTFATYYAERAAAVKSTFR